MSKKLIKNRQFNVGIVESYKATPQDSGHNTEKPILGSFSVNGMTVENMISQNRTKYSTEVWAQPTAFGQGGKFLDESGKLKPTTLLGSVDHPLDDRAEILLSEAAIAWYDVKRNEDGSWDGQADILNNPQGRIVKTFLDYAKERGGGDLLGVSSRALGESRLEESGDGQYEAIVPESFELMSFDFVYNPSFQTAVASINESSKGTRKSLTESIKSLSKDDEEHGKYYKMFAENLNKLGFEEETEEQSEEEQKEPKEENKTKTEGKSVKQAKEDYFKTLRAKEHELYNAIYELEDMDEEEFEKAYGKVKKQKVLDEMKAEFKEVKEELENLKNKQQESKKETKVDKETKVEAKHYSIELPKDKAKKLSKALKEEEIPYEPSEAGKLVHFEIACDESQKEAIEKFLQSLKESTDIIKESEHVFNEENKTIGEFVDDAKESEKDIYDEEDPEEDEDSDEEDSDEEDLEDDDELDLDLEEDEEDLEDLDELDEEDSLEDQVKEIKSMIEELVDFLMPVEDPEELLDDEELEELDDEDEEDEELEELGDEDEEEDILADLTEEDLEELTDEELEQLLSEVDD